MATRLHQEPIIGSWLHRLKNELDSCVAFLFRFMDYCFGTLNKERVKFLGTALVSAQGLLLGTWIKERVRFMCSVLVSAQGLLLQHID